MNNILESIQEYLFNEQIRAIDVIFISILTSFILWLINWIIKSSRKLIAKYYKRISKKVIGIYKLIFMKQLSMSHAIEIEKRLKNEEGIEAKL